MTLCSEKRPRAEPGESGWWRDPQIHSFQTLFNIHPFAWKARVATRPEQSLVVYITLMPVFLFRVYFHLVPKLSKKIFTFSWVWARKKIPASMSSDQRRFVCVHPYFLASDYKDWGFLNFSTNFCPHLWNSCIYSTIPIKRGWAALLGNRKSIIWQESSFCS